MTAKENLFLAFIALKFECDEIIFENVKLLSPCIVFRGAGLIVVVDSVIKKF